MSGLDPTAQAALQALGAARTPDAGAIDRAWQHLQERIVDGPPPLAIGPTAVPRRRATIVLATTALALAAAAALVLAWSPWHASDGTGAVVDGAPYSSAATKAETASPTPTPTPSSAPPAVDPTAVPSPSADDAAAMPPRQEVAPIESAPERPRVERAPRRRGGPESPASIEAPAVEPAPVEPTAPPKTTTLAAEMKLLAQANAAMRRGDPSAALAQLEVHRREFADGQLAPEREVARAVALCELGRREAARAVAEGFVRAHPGSPLRAKAEGVCRG